MNRNTDSLRFRATPEAYDQCINCSNNKTLPEWDRKIWRKRAIIIRLFISNLMSFEQFMIRNEILNFEKEEHIPNKLSNINKNNHKNSSANIKKKANIINNLRDKLENRKKI